MRLLMIARYALVMYSNGMLLLCGDAVMVSCSYLQQVDAVVNSERVVLPTDGKPIHEVCGVGV